MLDVRRWQGKLGCRHDVRLAGWWHVVVIERKQDAACSGDAHRVTRLGACATHGL